MTAALGAMGRQVFCEIMKETSPPPKQWCSLGKAGQYAFRDIMGRYDPERVAQRERLHDFSVIKKDAVDLAQLVYDQHQQFDQSIQAWDQEVLQDKSKMWPNLHKRSRNYIQLRNLTDETVRKLGQVNELILKEIDISLDNLDKRIAPERVRHLKKCLKAFREYNDEIDEMLLHQLDQVDETLLAEKGTNYLFFLREEIEARWYSWIDQHKSDDRQVSDKLDSVVSRALSRPISP